MNTSLTVFGSVVFSLAVLVPWAARADAPPKGELPTYYMVRCIEALPGKADEYKKFVLDTTAKAMQVRADEGHVAGWWFARQVMPSGDDKTCDFMQVNIQRGFPPERTPIDPYFVKAGVTITRTEWYATMGKQTKLSRLEMWRGVAELDKAEKDHYFRVDLLKVPANQKGAWLSFAREAKPAKERELAAGGIKGWLAQEIVLPGGAAYPYNARTVEVYPTWEAIGQALERPISAALQQRTAKSQEVVRSELFQMIAVIRPGKGGAPATATPAPAPPTPAAAPPTPAAAKK